MKQCKKISSILKIAASVLLFFAIVLTIYVIAEDGSSWGKLSAKLNENGVSTNLPGRIRFDGEYFAAMSEASGNYNENESKRIEAARKHFDHYQQETDEKANSLLSAALQTEITSFENEFDYEVFAQNYLAMENREEQREISQMIEKLDEMFKPAGKGGKKLAIKTVSSEETLKEGYNKLSARLSDCGSYYDYVYTVYTAIQQKKEAGESVASVSDFISSISDEEYLSLLASLEKEDAQGEDNISDLFYKQIVTPRLNGGAADVSVFVSEQYEAVKPYVPAMGSMDVFAKVLKEKLSDTAYDGSVSQLVTALSDAYAEKQNNSFATFLKSFSQDIVAQSDKSASVPFFGVLWAVASVNIWIWAASVLLYVLSYFTRKLAEKAIIDSVQAETEERPEDELLRVEHIKQYFRKGDFLNKAVDDVSFTIRRGEVLGLVGESGCGKTTTGRTIINLYDPTDGDVYFDGLRISSTQNGLNTLLYSMKADFEEEKEKLQEKLEADIHEHPEKKAELVSANKTKLSEMRRQLRENMEKARDHALISSVEKDRCIEKYRARRKAALTAAFERDSRALTGKELADRKKRYEIDMRLCKKDNMLTRMQMIFQDPIASINPRMTVREIIAEGLRIRGVKDKDYINEKVNEMLELVGLVREHADRYPHEFSGGQRQRIGIARAIVLKPDLIIADEPISALDVSIQAQVINLLNELRSSMGLTILFIAHNLSVVKYFSDHIAVMYYGKIVELAPSDELFAHPLHPYTKSLLSAIPYPDPHYEKARKRIEYNPAKAHDYSKDKPELCEIVPGHFIHCNAQEMEKYRKELGQ